METTIKDVQTKIEQLEREMKEEIRQINNALFGDPRSKDFNPGIQDRLISLGKNVEEVKKCTDKLTEFTTLKSVVDDIKKYIDDLKKEKEIGEKYQKRLWQYVIAAMTLVSTLGPAIGLALANALKGISP